MRLRVITLQNAPSPEHAETPWRSEDAFADVVGRWQEAGFDEIVVYYPPESAMPEGAVKAGVFEQAFTKG